MKLEEFKIQTAYYFANLAEDAVFFFDDVNDIEETMQIIKSEMIKQKKIRDAFFKSQEFTKDNA
jgi:MoxR-like ATPase